MEQKQVYCGTVYDQLPHLSENSQWLVAQSPEADEDQVFYNIHDPLCYYRCRIPELLGKRIRGTYHGWLILSNDNMWSLWNPLTSKIMRLPPLILKDGESACIKECCLSLPPEDPNSILLLARTDRPTFVFCRLDRKRKRLRWIEMSYDKQLKRLSGDGRLLHSLSCCNGKVYAVSLENWIMPLVIEIDIVVKAGEVVIELMLFSCCPQSRKHCSFDNMYFLRGSNTELFCIIIGFMCRAEYDSTFSCVTLHKIDISCINWAGLEGLKKWDLTGIDPEGPSLTEEDGDKLYKSGKLWEEMEDLKDANFFVDLARDNSVAYSPAIASAGGKIHIRSKMGKIIYSYNLND